MFKTFCFFKKNIEFFLPSSYLLENQCDKLNTINIWYAGFEEPSISLATRKLLLFSELKSIRKGSLYEKNVLCNNTFFNIIKCTIYV